MIKILKGIKISKGVGFWIDQLMPVLMFLVFFAAMARVEFVTPNLPDNDGFYHMKMAWLMRTEGLKPKFVWLPLTILNEKEYVDHHFLYHVLLVPFTFGNMLVGAKWAAVVFASVAMWSVWWLLKRQKIGSAWLWSIGLLGVSSPFLFRMGVTRAQSLSVMMLVLGMILLLEKKYKYLIGLSFVYVWMYDAFPLILVMSIWYLVAVWVVKRKWEYKPVIYAMAGLLVGLVVNPYFPKNVIFIMRHIWPKLVSTTQIGVGAEWYPYDSHLMLLGSGLAFLLVAVGVVALGLNGRKMNLGTALALLMTLTFGAMFFEARRFVEYFAPFALIFAAFAVEAVCSGGRNKSVCRWKRVMLMLLWGVAIYQAFSRVSIDMLGSKKADRYREVSAWLESNTPKNARVFNQNWDDFPRLFFYNTHNQYMVGLDTTYMQTYDNDLYGLWNGVNEGGAEEIAEAMKVLDSKYLVVDVDSELEGRAEADAKLERIYADREAAVYKIKE